MAETPKWYVVHTYSGYENKVAQNIEKVVENQGFGDLIFEVKIPTESGKWNAKSFPVMFWSK